MRPQRRRAIPPAEWVWCGYPGHFCGADRCRLHLNTRVGDYRISTVGDYWPRDGQGPQDVGAGRKYETFVFRVEGKGHHGEGEVVSWLEIWSRGYNSAEGAERGHMNACRLFARVAAGIKPEPGGGE